MNRIAPRKRRMAVTVASLTVAVIALAGCSATASGAGAKSSSRALTTVNVGYTTTSVTDEAPFLVGTAEGFFASHGCQLGDSIQAANGGANAMQSILNGGLDMGEVATNAAIEAVLGGTQVTAVGSSPQGAYDMTYAELPGTNIHKPADLKGKKLGFTSPGSATEDMAYLLINSAGLTPNDVTLAATNGMGGGIALLDSHGVDVALMTPITYRSEPSGKYVQAFNATDFVGAYQKGVYIANDDFISSHPDAVKCVLAGLDDAMKFIVTKPSKAAADVAAADNTYTVDDLSAELKYAVKQGAFDGTVGMNAKGLQNVTLAYKLRTGKSPNISWSKMFNTSFLPTGASTTLPSGS